MMIMMMLLQLMFVSSLLVFLVTGLVVASDYQSEDVLCLRRILRDDVLRLGFLFNTPGLQAAHWSVFDGLSWAAHTLNSATEKLFLISKELFEGFKSRKINHGINTNKEPLTETEKIKAKTNINHFSEAESSKKASNSNSRDNTDKDSDRYREKPKHFENQDKSTNRWKH